MAVKPIAIVALTAAGAELGRRIQPHLRGAVLHGLTDRVHSADAMFEDAAEHLRDLFRARHPVVGVCAAGILIRALAPALGAKADDPPVLAISEDGKMVVPLLGGHRGANTLARMLAQALGGTAAITTAGDVTLGVSLDEPPPGWRIANPAALKPTAAALLAKEPVALRVDAGDADWLRKLDFHEGASRSIVVTHRACDNDASSLVYHPPVLALGVGCERGVAADELEMLARETLQANDLSPQAVAAVVSLDVKADEAAVHALANSFGVAVRFFDAEALAREEPRLSRPSDVVRQAVGVAGVAEAAALACAGPDSTLIVPKTRSARATCAVALATRDIDVKRIGRPRGELFIVGIGPGSPAWRTPDADTALALASDVVGYGLYLDLLGPALAGKQRHESALGEEEARARLALELAATGRSVALVSSGDAGIYGLAALVFELLDRNDNPAWRRVAVRVCPGVSALQAAAARAGAPLGHDFCAISLSDLLTPWPEIERRLHAAADGDFVVALYNPASARRRAQLGRARDILLSCRTPDTPVVVARNLGRPGERVEATTLGELDDTKIDMLTLLLIGNRQTRAIRSGSTRWIYTPRGYAAKRTPPSEAAASVPAEER